MKKLLLCLFMFSGIHFAAKSQSILPDSAFGGQGLLISGVSTETTNPYGKDIVMQPDGKVLVVGYGSATSSNLTIKRYDTIGQLDTSFHQPINQYSYAFPTGICLQSDGKVLTIFENIGKIYIMRMLPSGVKDLTFGNNGITALDNGTFYYDNIFTQTDGKIIFLGANTTFNGSENDFRVVRLNSNGMIDSTFGQNGTFLFDFSKTECFVDGAQQADGKLLFCGLSSKISFGYVNTLVRLNQDGTLDDGFGSGGVVLDTIKSGELYALAIQADGKILVTGYWKSPYNAIVKRFLPDGTPDPDFGTAGVRIIENAIEGVGILVKPDGKILTLLQRETPDYRPMLVQLLPNGQNDPNFGINGVYESNYAGLRTRTFSYANDALIISNTGGSSTDLPAGDYAVLLRFILDLSVGTLDPAAETQPEPFIYPNPIISNFTLKYDVTTPQSISIRLTDEAGRRVHTFQENTLTSPGHYESRFDIPAELPKGVYILSVESGQKQIRSVRVVKG
ncbi:MAG: T9SS type A sorting domain-containing protein [Bacteroidota bacterium]